MEESEVKQPAVYVLASRRNGTLYTGVTSDLPRRVHAHRSDAVDGLTKCYSVHLLVWYELHDTREAAKARERKIKKWNRDWKVRLIEELNPQWRDLYETLNQ